MHPETRIADSLPRENRITDVHLISSLVRLCETNIHQKNDQQISASPRFPVRDCSLFGDRSSTKEAQSFQPFCI